MTRPLPEPDADTAFFWEAAQDHVLMILRCAECGHYIHYPKPVCSQCTSTDVRPTKVSGLGVIHSFTITHFPVPGYEPPFVVALIELAEQQGLRLISNIVGTAPDDVFIGMPVTVFFEQIADGVTLPLFERAP